MECWRGEYNKIISLPGLYTGPGDAHRNTNGLKHTASWNRLDHPAA